MVLDATFASSLRPRVSLITAAAALVVTATSAAAPAHAFELGLGTAPTRQPIVGGDLDGGDPSVPLLAISGSDGEQGICTGSLVGDQWVLTAAHCVDPLSLGFEAAQVEVYFGTEYASNDPGFVDQVFADGYIFHEDWNANDLEGGNDIALLHLERAIDLPVVPLMGRPLAFEEVGSPIRLIGWGITGPDRGDSGVKRHVVSTLFDFDATLVLVGDAQTNVCSGDSGGPTVIRIDGRDVQIGVTSFGDVDCAQTGVSTRVDAFIDWVVDATDGEVQGLAASGAVDPPSTGGPANPGRPGGAQTCDTHEDCTRDDPGGVCVDDGSVSMCSRTCSTSADCGAGMECFESDDPSVGVCWPTTPTQGPGTPGKPEKTPIDRPEDDDGSSDGDGESRGGGGSAPTLETDDEAGCSVVGGAGGPVELLPLFFACYGAARRRRRR